MTIRQYVRSMEQDWKGYAATLADPSTKGFSRRVLIRAAIAQLKG